MNFKKRFMQAAAALLVGTCIASVPVSAAEMKQDGLEVTFTAEKATYQTGDPITATIKVTNTNTVSALNVSLEELLPAGYTVSGSDAKKTIGKLEPNATEELTVTCKPGSAQQASFPAPAHAVRYNDSQNTADVPPGYVTAPQTAAPAASAEKTTAPARSEQTANSPETADQGIVYLLLLMLGCGGCAVIIRAVSKDRTKKHRVLSLFVCAALTGTAAQGAFPLHTRAADSAIKTIELSETVNVAGSDVILKAVVAYQFSDDAQLLEDTEVTEKDFYVLSSKTREINTNESVKVLFNVDSTLATSSFSLYADGKDTGVKLLDDGVSSLGDDIPSDGCYSGYYTLSVSSAGKTVFTAKANIGGTDIETNEFSITAYDKVTDEVLEEETQIRDALRKIIKDTREENKDLEQAALLSKIHENLMTALKEYESQGKVKDIAESKENYSISYVFTGSGFHKSIRYYSPSENHSKKNADNGLRISEEAAPTAKALKEIDTDYITYSEKALLLCADAKDDPESAINENASNMEQVMKDAGFDTTVRYSATVDSFKDMQDYDYIQVCCHGSTGDQLTDSLEYEEFPIICTEQDVTESLSVKYQADIQAGRVQEVEFYDDEFDLDEEIYCICPEFFTFYYSADPLKAKFVKLDCCESAKVNTKLVDAFVTAGADSVYGYSESVFGTYDDLMSMSLMKHLLDGMTVGEALTSSRSEIGQDSLEWAAANTDWDLEGEIPAVPAIYGNSNVRIHSDLRNGNFDNTLLGFFSNLNHWKKYGDARSIHALSGLSPKSDPNMAIISSGFGSLNDQTTSCIYQTILVPADAKTIEFSYDVISEEPMEYVNTKYNDVFQADILDTDGTVLEQLAYESVNTSNWISIAGIDFPGGDETTFHTRWNTVTSDKIAAYQGKLVVIRFIVQDAGDAIYDTAAIVDSVKIS